jgi:O-antigen ligase
VTVWHFSCDTNKDGRPGEARIQRYLAFSYWISVVACLTVFKEYWDLEPYGITHFLRILVWGGARPGGVFGNPALAGGYLLLHFFYGIYYFRATLRRTDERRPATRPGHQRLQVAKRIAVIFGQALICLAIYVGQTRSVFLGLVAGVFSVVIFFVFSQSAGRRVRLAGILVMGAIAVGAFGLWHFRNTSFVAGLPLASRLTQLSTGQNLDETDASQITAFVRLITWRSALQGFLDRPVLGWGYDNTYYALSKHYDPQVVRFRQTYFLESLLTWWDKTHNQFVDMLVERGIVGVLLYLLLVSACVRTLWHMTNRFLTCCLAAGLVAYGVNNVFVFDGFGSLLGFHLYLACLALAPLGSTGIRIPGMKILSGGAARLSLRASLPRPAVCVATVLGILSAGLYLNYQMAAASAAYVQAQSAFGLDSYVGVGMYEKAFDGYFSPYSPYQKLNCGLLVANAVLQKKPLPDPAANIEWAIQLAEEALEAHPKDARAYITVNDIYNTLALGRDPKYAERAETYGLKAVELSPRRQEAMFNLGRTYVIRGEAKRAVELNREMVRNYPSYPVAHWFLGLALLAGGERSAAQDEIKLALRLGYRFQNPQEREFVLRTFPAEEMAPLMDGK